MTENLRNISYSSGFVFIGPRFFPRIYGWSKIFVTRTLIGWSNSLQQAFLLVAYLPGDTFDGEDLDLIEPGVNSLDPVAPASLSVPRVTSWHHCNNFLIFLYSVYLVLFMKNWENNNYYCTRCLYGAGRNDLMQARSITRVIGRGQLWKSRFFWPRNGNERIECLFCCVRSYSHFRAQQSLGFQGWLLPMALVMYVARIKIQDCFSV